MPKALKVIALVGLFFGFALAANAQTLLAQIVWNADYTVWPPVLQTSSGGVIGGDWIYTITFPTSKQSNDYYIVNNVTLVSGKIM